MDEAERVSYRGGGVSVGDDCVGSLAESDVTERLRSFVNTDDDRRRMCVVLLASGGHFAGTVFNGKSVVAHKTFHRYGLKLLSESCLVQIEVFPFSFKIPFFFYHM